MTTAARLGRAALAAFLLGCATAGPALATTMPLAAPAASSVQDKVTDDAGALTASEKSELEDKIAQLQKDQHLVVYVVFADSLPGGA